MNYDRQALEDELHDRLDTALEELVEWAGRETAMRDGIASEDAARDVAEMVKKWLTQAKANAIQGSYKPSLKSCGG